jgi:hypothetical protein
VVASSLNGTEVYDEFYASKLGVPGLDSGTLSGLRFKKITIVNSDLVYIDPEVFAETADTTKAINLSNNKLINLIFPGKGDLFEAFKVLSRVQVIVLEHNNIQSIPAKAFQPHPGSDSKVWYIDLAKNRIADIGDHAFASLPFLTYLDISGNRIKTMSGSAFESNGIPFVSGKMTIFLGQNMLTEQSFESQPFAGLKRPVELYVQKNRFSMLPRRVFEPFLRSKFGNIMDMENNLIQCQEVCPLQWLVQNDADLRPQILGLTCSDETSFWDQWEAVREANCSLFKQQEVEEEVVESESSTPLGIITTTSQPYLPVVVEEEDRERHCPVGHYQCLEGRCLPIGLICDGNEDCESGDDEEFCTPRPDLIAVTVFAPINDTTAPCPDAEDREQPHPENSFVSINIKLNRLNHTIVKKVLSEIGINDRHING